MKSIPSAEVMAERWVVGMLRTPPVQCPVCHRRTRAELACQYCKKIYTGEELAIRNELRKLFIARYGDVTKRQINEEK